MNDALFYLLCRFLGTPITGDITNNSNVIINILDTSNVNINDVIIGDGLPAGTSVLSKTANTVTISATIVIGITFTTYYTHKKNIFIGYQNNYTLPTDNNYAIISRLDTGSNGIPVSEYNDTTETTTYVTAFTPLYQFDFYGKYAETTATYLQTVFLSKLATEYLAQYGMSVYQVKPITNLTESMDYEEYTVRYVLKVSFFANTVVTDKNLGTNLINNEFLLAEIQQ